LAGANFRWAVCGGYALDLFLERPIRRHGDIDISVFEQDRRAVECFMLRQGWQVYQFLGQGRLRRIFKAGQSESGRNLMCLHEGCGLVRLYPCDEENVFLHEFFHTGIERLDYIEFLFAQTDGHDWLFRSEPEIRLALERAVLRTGDISYLAPELALLYKASAADRPEYALDYRAVRPQMDDRQRHWLQNGLNALYPQGHPWRGEQP